MNNRGKQGIPGREGHVGEEGEVGARGRQGIQGIQGEVGPVGPAHVRSWWERHRGLVGYVILVFALVVSSIVNDYQNDQALERIEQETTERREELKRLAMERSEEIKNEVCNAVLENDRTLVAIIEIALRPRADDSPHEAERREEIRQELLEQVTDDSGCGEVGLPPGVEPPAPSGTLEPSPTEQGEQ